jgi:hypothetical protein
VLEAHLRKLNVEIDIDGEVCGLLPRLHWTAKKGFFQPRHSFTNVDHVPVANRISSERKPAVFAVPLDAAISVRHFNTRAAVDLS